ncbi:MAG TPA: SufS family cysteine desulfurase [Acidimicrobiales bacterium]
MTDPTTIEAPAAGSTSTPGAAGALDVSKIRKDFPIFERRVRDRRLVYLDSANTSQKPRAVLDAIEDHYERSNANVHRGTYLIAEEATAAFEGARSRVASFVGAGSPREVVFTKNATEALNLVAKAWGRSRLRPGDPVVITELEHHANIVPWHQLVEEIGIELRWIPLADDGHLDLTDLDRLVDGARVVSFAATSNVLGTLLPVERLVAAAHDAGAIAVVDASQHVPHLPTDVGAWGADFVAFTAHKMCGPTGIGVLWGTENILDATPPFLTGGEMILNVTKEGFTPNELPWKFEAGTPPIAEAVGLGAAVDYLSGLGMEAVREHEVSLTGYALRSLTERFGNDLRIHGPSEPSERGGVLSFSYRDVHPHDLTQVFDEHGVCVRAGHHCAKPLMRELGVAATARASLYVYNDTDDVDALADAIVATRDFFAA